MDPAPNNDLLLDVRNLRTSFFIEGGEVRAVDGASFTLRRGKTLAIVGESGCGKSVTAYSVLRLIQPPGKIVGGQMLFHPRAAAPIDLAGLDDKSATLFQVRGGMISMIFQEPMTALSPVHTIGNQITEAILLHQPVTKQQAADIAAKMLGRVGIPNPTGRLKQYPYEISGGMRQRVVIAMALACNPQLLIADEPTTALDVTIQAQILALIKSLQAELGTAVLLITHDLGVVAQVADDVAVMYLGRIVEQGPLRNVIKHPRHPYTRGLLQSRPNLDGVRRERLPSIEGTVPSLTAIPAGCPFHPRCPHAKPGLCDTGNPPPLDRGVACVRAGEITP